MTQITRYKPCRSAIITPYPHSNNTQPPFESPEFLKNQPPTKVKGSIGKILVTGAAGKVGKQLVNALLKEGEDVKIPSRNMHYGRQGIVNLK
jgi:hypothetical protein